MKSLKPVLICSISLVCAFITTSCGGKKEPEAPLYQAYELQGKDTINKVDSAGLKQGPWFFYADKGKKGQKTAPKLLVKGTYVDDKREGTWYYYSIDGSPSDTVVYRNDFPLEQ